MDTVTGASSGVQIRVLLRERNTEAWVKVEPPVPCDVNQIKNALANHGVVYGLDEMSILAVAAYPGEEPARVAQGTLPQPGQDAKITYFFKGGGIGAGKPLELEDGRVDYRELGTIENVTRGQVLASKAPAGPGLPGTNVLGEEIPARDGKDAHLRAGQNVVLSEDQLHVTSLIDGQPKIDGSRISVQPMVVIMGDVDFSTGNINFQGSVRIGGNVLPGFTVKATQDIEIGGVVEGASIESGGKVTIKGGVRQHSVITSHADVSVRFVDSESSITTRANLVVVESAMHSALTAGLAIKVGKKLIGGTAQAGEFISAEQIGATGGTHTVLDVRHGRQAKVIEQLQRAIGTLNSQLSTVNHTYQLIVSNPNAPQGAFEKTREIKTQLESRLDQLTAELNERQAQTPAGGNLRAAFVAARDGFNAGVHIHFDQLFHHVDSFLPIQRIAEVNGALSML
jgi:uncharacterized protein (DUF342 family)